MKKTLVTVTAKMMFRRGGGGGGVGGELINARGIDDVCEIGRFLLHSLSLSWSVAFRSRYLVVGIF